ncbi:MAG: hypothetical protein JRG94_05670 [Deltaproteobacteria bacterium]|nr:hypothetical protein [Deltaproteobacteria bacterium]
MSNQVANERIERAECGAAQFAATHDLVLVVGEDALVLYVGLRGEDRPNGFAGAHSASESNCKPR